MLEFRCSGLSRVMACAGSPFFTDLPDEEESAPAREGTAAGEFLAHLLAGTRPGTHASNGVPFDSDMEFYTRPIAEEIFSRAQTQVLCEQRVDWATRSGIIIRGQYDAGYIGKDGKLYIDDLKYGWGIVECKENWQLLGYAIGEIIRRQEYVPSIVMRIHQPRPHHEDGSTRAWEISYAELLGYKEKIEAQMDKIAAGDKTLTTSKCCRYCPAAGERCPAISKAMYKSIDYIHEFLQDKLNEEELSAQLKLVERVTEVLKIKSESLKALAVDRIKKGKIIPGYVTEASYGDRKWKANVSPEVIKVLTGKNIVDPTMLSPNKAEKAGVPKEVVNALVERHFLGQKLVAKDAGAIGDKIFGKGKPS